MRRHWGILGVPLVSGCSFMFMHAPPDNHAKLRYFDCVSSTAAPVTDTANAAAHGVFVAFAAQDQGEDGAEPPSPLLFGGFAALHLASAIYGYVGAAKCNSAKQNLANRLHQREAEDARRIDALERQLKSPRVGCSTDADCKGDRICVNGGCDSPAPKAAPLPLAPAAPEVVPESAPIP